MSRGLPITTRDPGRTFYGIQALRAIAALLVVVEHGIYLWYERVLLRPLGIHYWTNGAAGVDIFFVVSGFVMTIALPGIERYPHPVRVFLRRRITRIVPLYWLATSLKIALLLLIPGLAVHQALKLTNVLGSYLFIPVPNAENEMFPVIVVGWTLNFEMFFYLTFSLSMVFRGRLYRILTPLLTGLAAVHILHRPSWPAVTTLASPMLLEFLFGVLIARMATRERLPGLVTSWILLGTGLLAILSIRQDLEWRFLLWGVPAAAIVLGAVGLEESLGASIPRWIISLGDASYAIYLVQTFMLPLIGIAIVKLSLNGIPALFACIVGGLVLSILAGEIVHRFIEKPILEFLKNRHQRGAGVIA